MMEQISPTTVRLFPGRASDLGAVVDIMDSAFDERFGEAWTRSQCAGILPMPGVSLLIARDEAGAMTGFALYRIIAGDAELLLLAVTPKYRRRRIGWTLLHHFIEAARDEGVSNVHLEVREGNPAVAMYRRAGFSPCGRRRKYYRGRSGGEFDALTFSLSL